MPDEDGQDPTLFLDLKPLQDALEKAEEVLTNTKGSIPLEPPRATADLGDMKASLSPDRRLDFFDRGTYFSSFHDSATNSSIRSEFFHDEELIAHLSFNNVTWITSHNAHANNFAAGDNMVRQMATNQEFSIYKQLKDIGVRGLMLDVQYLGDGIKLVHGLVEYSWLDDIIHHEITPFLDEDENAIITIDLETLGNRELIMKELRVILQQTTGFTRRIFRLADDRWANHTEWPTIQEMRDADQRIIIFSDSAIVKSDELGIMLRSSIVIENHWRKGLDNCSPRNEHVEDLDIPWTSMNIVGKTWTRLFTMNHFCCATGIESLQRVNPANIGGGDNGWGVLYPRAMMCTDANGHSLKPNFIAVDWAHIGDANEVAGYLNFGGRIGTGQPCRSGLDCATGACSVLLGRCHCHLCTDDCTSGCLADEMCVESDVGVNECISNTTGVVIPMYPSNGATSLMPQGLAFSLLWVLVPLHLFLAR